jgi:hypothetical protein
MAYYSKEVGTIYHKCRSCFAGNNIEHNNMTEGQPRGARLCKICANLASLGKCTAGIPMGAIPKIKTYYSKLQKAIYHNCKNCNVGNNMVKGNLLIGKPKPVKGRDGKIRKPRLCRTCEALKNAGTAVFGIPELPREKRGAKVKTYYSDKHPEIFHICQNCYLGQNIEE